MSRACRSAALALCLSRRADRPSAPVRRCAGRRLLHQHDVGPRHRARPAVRHRGWTACGSMSARRKRATKPKHFSPTWRRRERGRIVFTIPRQRAFRRNAGARTDRAAGRAIRSRCRDATIYLPTRRAARSFGEAFAARAGRRGAAAAIPRAGRHRRRRICCSTPSAKAWSCRPPSRRSGGNCCWRALVRRWDARRAAGR